MRSASPFLPLFALLALGGCAAQNSMLYHWGEYPNATYAHLRQDLATPEEQLAALLKTVADAERSGRAVPPGLHAHIGMLYAQLGEPDLASDHWLIEKTLFPAAAPFMDFTLNNFQP